jgi:hypothetical protein
MSSFISFVRSFRLSLSHPHPYNACLYFCVYTSICLSDRRVPLTVIRTHTQSNHLSFFFFGVYITRSFACSQSCRTVAAITKNNRTVMRVILCRLHMVLYDGNTHIINHHRIGCLYRYIHI